MAKTARWWTLELEGKPDFEKAMQRIYAWFEQEVIDRPPIRFTTHNAEFEQSVHSARRWPDLRTRWFDVEYQLDLFIESIQGRRFQAETFPVFWPNLGPEVFAAFYGAELVFEEVTSYSVPVVRDWSMVGKLKLDMANAYFRQIEELTRVALERCDRRFLVGYTDLHPGVDCAAAWRDPMQYCLDLILHPKEARALIGLASAEYQKVYDHFDAILKARRQLSVTWMGIPSFGKMHIPSCDFAAMISPRHFEEYCLPTLRREVLPMTHNIFHLDGKGVAVHLDRILEIPEIQAIQWVQGVGRDKPILQWVPLIKRIQAAGKSVVVDVDLKELDLFIERMDPEGIYLCVSADEEIQPEIMARVERW